MLLLTTGTGRGGAELQVALLAVELQARGWDVLVVGMIPPGPIATQLQAAGVPCQSLEMDRGRPSLRALRAFRAIVRSYAPDLVHAHMVHANIFARLAIGGRRTWPPLICTVHNIDEGGGWRSFAYRLTDRLAYRTTHCSSIGLDAQRRAGLLSTERSLWIPNALRFSTTPPPHAPRPVSTSFHWCYVGRVEPVKRLPHLLTVFERVLGRHPSARLHIVGGGSDEALLHARCQSEPLRSAVTLSGPQDDVASCLAQADGFVSLASREGMPLTILEAGSQALPVVTTAVGGVPELVPSPQHGWLVDQSEAAAVEAMCAVMELAPEARARIGERLRTHITEQYSREQVMPQWMALYQAARSTRSPARS